MQSYIIFNPATGEILSTGACVSAKLPTPPQGMVVMRGVANDALQKVVDGKVVDKSPSELPPPRPKAPLRKILLQTEWDDLIKRIELLES
jgi:hypothetical protein